MTGRKQVAPDRPRAHLRCAVYTRKSSEEGLEQSFNSLDAQRDACEAFIKSQRHEGWHALPAMYDDGGFSGGTSDRPALKRLLADVAAGKVDIVVVYKVDRLTRSLGDFARIVELFDKHVVSFVSVTQAFNTTTSMGRLTLNVLLSFAQFEREVTSERIRDKIAASKRKGMWMGGNPPLGYDVRDRKLVVNESEASTVRSIFRRYIELRSVRDLKADLNAAGVVSKARRASDGSPKGAQRFARGALYHMLSNRLYRGEIVHKGEVYPGEHCAIVDEEAFQEVQSILEENRVERTSGPRRSEPSLLTGLVYDAKGERLTPTHAVKKGTRYRYYVSSSLVTGANTEAAGQRIPAAALEGAVRKSISDLLSDPAALLEAFAPCRADEQQLLLAAAARQQRLWSDLASNDLRQLLLAVLSRVEVHPDRIDITVDVSGLIGWQSGHVDRPNEESRDFDRPMAKLSLPVSLKRRGNELRFVIAAPAESAKPDAGLMRLVAQAHHIARRLLNDRGSIDDVAQQERLSPSYVTRLVRISFLAPDITARLISGRHDQELTARKLMADTRFPLEWAEQRKVLRLI